MIDEGRARRRDLAHDVVRRADHQCRDAAGFDHVGDETDGLMAERSVGNEQGEIDLRLAAVLAASAGASRFQFLSCRRTPPMKEK